MTTSSPANDYFVSPTKKIQLGSPKKNYFSVHSFFKSNKKIPAGVFRTNDADLSLDLNEKKIYCYLGDEKKYSLSTLKAIFATLVTAPNVDCNIDLNQFVTPKIALDKVINLFFLCFFRCRRTPLSYKKKPTPPKQFAICLQAKIKPAVFNEHLRQAMLKIGAINLASDWQDAAPNKLTSESFAQIIADRWATEKKIKFSILQEKEIRAEKMNLLLAVNAGSQYGPRFVVGEYKPNPKKPIDLVLIGKGIMFDSGGYSLKPANYQLNMKFDMSGAASVLAAFEALVRSNINLNIVVLTPLTDNLIGTKATIVESVVTAKDGQTVEITNTDAEGRLVLADAIAYANAHYSPTRIIELSTLTGAISVALGRENSGAFSNQPAKFKQFEQLAATADEPIWFLPVTPANFQRMKDSRVADLLNASPSYQASSSNAAAFLFSFAKKTPFLHLDIGGTAYTKSGRGQGILVQTIFNYSQALAQSLVKKNQL